MPKFSPKKPFALFKEGTNHTQMGRTSAFISKLVKQHIDSGGVLMNVYRYLGPVDQDRDANGVKIDTKGSTKPGTDIGSFMPIGDTVLLENRDRKFDFDEIPRLRGVYQVSQYELEYARFGAMLSNDSLTVEFHAGEMEKQLGRRLVMGDVVEMPHLRDVGADGRAMNKWYEVSSIVWSPSGIDAMYIRHVLGVVLRPLKHQQEFMMLFEKHKDEYGQTLAETNSNLNALLAITGANKNLAQETVPVTGSDTRLFWIDPAWPDRGPDLYTDDLNPPNGAIAVGQGNSFPIEVADGDWYVRDDFEPPRLYQFKDEKWSLRKISRKRDWVQYNHWEFQRQFMSDRSEADRKRPYELRSIHDVMTDRQYRSDPTGDQS